MVGTQTWIPSVALGSEADQGSRGTGARAADGEGEGRDGHLLVDASWDLGSVVEDTDHDFIAPRVSQESILREMSGECCVSGLVGDLAGSIHGAI